MSYVDERIAQIRAEQIAAIEARAAIKREPKKAERPRGHIYFMKAGNAVKIGFSTNLKQRLASIQTGCPDRAIIVKVVAGDVRTERAWSQVQILPLRPEKSST